MESYYKSHAQGVILRVQVTPKSGKSEIIGPKGDVLKVRLAAPPEKGKANDALILLLSKVFGIPKSSIHLLRGSTSRQKDLLLQGITPEQLTHIVGN